MITPLTRQGTTRCSLYRSTPNHPTGRFPWTFNLYKPSTVSGATLHSVWTSVAEAIHRALGMDNLSGCLFIIGDDMGCSFMRDQFLHDIEILKHWSQSDTNSSRVTLFQMACQVCRIVRMRSLQVCFIELDVFTAQQQRKGVENYAFKSESGNIVEWVIVDNQPKDVVLGHE